ncbi:precorrin-3B synthase [Rhizobium sp. AC44/96]|uniref:precorrin-3B synthase n=1 Tax=Rhizobium sp. AC44/96 TaxID=1841654 RepID=UPI00080FC4A7|nr:precorrin-3B synthase [Rhizobium sp. AC44/96]OCJ09221.1 precorrin-3B synthase [Rhizobium sp. AC44/96]
MTRAEQIAPENTRAPLPATQRGACPTLMEPMRTGDGLLARLRPEHGIFTIGQFKQLAQAAQRHGNGIIEITARGSVQIRGLTADTAPMLASNIDAAGIVIPPAPVIELPPLHGIFPDEMADAAVMERELRRDLALLFGSPLLAPKLSIVIDGGGRRGLAAVSADIRLCAVSSDVWHVAIDGDAQSARTVATGSSAEAIRTVGAVLELLLSMGRHKRARDITAEHLSAAHLPATPTAPGSLPGGETAAPGVHAISAHAAVVGLRPRFGQLLASDVIDFLGLAERAGAQEVRPAPGRCFIVTGLTQTAAITLKNAAIAYNMFADHEDPYGSIAVCAGAGACASAFYPTKTLAETIATAAPELLDGSLDIHLSGCIKGCAHPRPAALTLAGTADGYHLIVDGAASSLPDAQIASGDIDSAIQRLARLIKTERHAGESAGACLRRLGKGTATRALRQE